MNQKILNTKTRPGGDNTSLTRTRVSENKAKTIKPLGRNALKQIHAEPELVSSQDLSNTSVAKGVNIAKQGAKSSLESGLSLLSSASNGLIDATKTGVQNKNIKGILMAVLGGIFGLSSIKGLLGAPKVISNKEDKDKQAPALIKFGKWLAGGSIALGAFKALAGGAGLTNPALVFGLVIFGVLHSLIKGFEDDNSITGKLINTLGLKSKVKDIADDIRLDNLMPN